MGRAWLQRAVQKLWQAQQQPIPSGSNQCGMSQSPTAWSVVLAMDTSGSMEGTKLHEAKTALLAFLNEVDFSETEVSLVTFGDYAMLRVPLCQDLFTLRLEILSYFASGDTPFLSALEVAEQALRRARGQKLIVIASDGHATDAVPAEIQAFCRNLKAQGIKIITIAIGKFADRELLMSIASSPDDFHFADSAIQLKPIYKKVAGGLIKRS